MNQNSTQPGTAEGAEYTAGPWSEPERSGDGKVIVIEKYGPGNDNWKRLRVEVDSDDCDSATAMANARLIWAAPDLLEACVAALPHVPGVAKHVREMLIAAIAKAQGKQP
jgi:hypothetical protein